MDRLGKRNIYKNVERSIILKLLQKWCCNGMLCRRQWQLMKTDFDLWNSNQENNYGYEIRRWNNGFIE